MANVAIQNEIVSRQGWTRGELDAAFKTVQHPKNWKFGNEAPIRRADFEKVNEATIFFAGSPLRIVHDYGIEDFILVRFDGYYACIGA
jgi:hypothetical protein